MHELRNDELTVTLLDPVDDRERMGTRYCTGGYIFMVADPAHGDLLSGPTYPASFNTFDGQGIPDAFNKGPLRDPESDDPLALVPGVGVCDLRADRVMDWCAWEIDKQAAAIRMVTRHQFRGFAMEIDRQVSLIGCTVRSATTVRNTGTRAPICWFPHPFYPHPVTDELCKFNIPVRFSENPGYEMGANGFIRRKGWKPGENFFQALDHDATVPLVVIQKHPLLGQVSATCSYAPAFFPIWGNACTFSWEPYIERTLDSGQSLSWWIDYDF